MGSDRHVYWVLPGLLAGRPGPGEIPWDLGELWEAGFRTIVSLSRTDGTAIRALGFRHYYVSLKGGLAFLPLLRRRLARQVLTVVDFIAAEIAAGRPTLVHCRQGNDRTGAVLAGYLIHHQGLAPAQAIRRLQALNPRILRSPGFKRLVNGLAEMARREK